MALTDLAARNAKGREAPYKLADGGSMYLLVKPDGARYWRMDYRFGGKRRTLALGVYPEVSLLEAREKRVAARKLLETGIDPGQQKQLDRLSAAVRSGNTFQLIGREYLDKMRREGRAENTLSKTEWLLSLVEPSIGSRPVADISPPELLEALRIVERKGRFETARRLRSTCGAIFRYAIATGRATRDPSRDLIGALTAPKPKHRAAIIEPKGIGELLRAIDGFEGQPVTLAALKLAALLFVRPGELRHAEWAEFDFDAAVWIIPAEKMKMRRPHRVPLSKQAVALLLAQKPLTGRGRYVFPCVRTFARPMSENTLNAALRRLGYNKNEMTAHGFRATASTRLNEMRRWSPDAIERQLAHQEANDIRRAYTHAAEYWAERVEMMQAWADYLDRLRRGGDVVNFQAEVAKG
jgi:integrase